MKPWISLPLPILASLLSWSPMAGAGEVQIVEVKAECRTSCTFHVTLRHGDEGWDHYADRWDVLLPSGEVLKSRVLYHPHVDEQPFTRSLSGVSIPPDVTQVLIRARDNKHGFSKDEFSVRLPGR